MIIFQNITTAQTTEAKEWWGGESTISVSGDLAPASVQFEYEIEGIGFAPVTGLVFTSDEINPQVRLPKGKIRAVITGTPTGAISAAILNHVNPSELD